MSTANDITTKLWAMANKLRGTMDASEYKNYILPFMFYRYLSENQDVYLAQNGLEEFYDVTDKEEQKDYLEDISSNLGYAIKPEYTWERLVAKIENHRIKASDFQDMFDSFETQAKRNPMAEQDFANVFSDINLGDSRLGSSTNERAKALNDIVLMIHEFSFKDESGRDFLGDVNGYLIGHFAANAGKKGGEFYTPHEVSQILAKLVTMDAKKNIDQFRVYDPTMGSGSLLLTVQKALSEGEHESSVDFYGQELNTTTYNLARMNLMMHGVNYRNMNLKRGDTLDADWPFAEKDGIQLPLKFDAVVANPPYSQKWEIKSIDRSKDSRFKFGVAPASKADYAFVLHGLYHLESTGTMAIVLPHGVLFRRGAEGKIRLKIIDEALLHAVYGLPASLIEAAIIPTCVLVFKGRKARGKRSDVLFIDASNDFEKGKNQNRLTADNITKIIETYHKREYVDKYAHVASLEEIKENGYNLNIPRYVDTFEEEEVAPLSEVAQELTQVRSEIEATSASLFKLLGELEGTTEDAKNELAKFVELLKR